MSVLIRGMEMPISCDDCEFCKRAISGYDWCCVPMMKEKDKPLDEPVLKPDWCPLIPVPEHGRLIEADRIELYMQDEWMNNELSNGDWILFRERLNETPTIIPASEEATP